MLRVNAHTELNVNGAYSVQQILIMTRGDAKGLVVLPSASVERTKVPLHDVLTALQRPGNIMLQGRQMKQAKGHETPGNL